MNDNVVPTTGLCKYTSASIKYRDKDLVDELLSDGGDFTKTMAEHILGRSLSREQLIVVNAVLIVLMEHGLTPSAIASRLTYLGAPESVQGAVASGLLSVGSQFVGTVENNARILAEIVATKEEAQIRVAARKVVDEHLARGEPLPGFGHHLHKPYDPRALKLIEIGRSLDLPGRHLRSLSILSEELDAATNRHTTINATGAVAALLGEIDVPVDAMRGFAIISRAAGLVAHVVEEQRRPSGRYIWNLVDQTIPFEL